MEKIEKILEINHPSFEWIKNYFNNFNYSDFDYSLFPTITNNLIRHNDNFPLNGNILTKIRNTCINNFNNNEFINKLEECVDYLCSIYDIKYMWLMIYKPKSYLDFHWDRHGNRHIISFHKDERFFNYELNADSDQMMTEDVFFNTELKKNLDNIDKFNEFFLKQSNLCNIINFEPNCIYTFGKTLHTFYNDSNKIRINLVFEIVE